MKCVKLGAKIVRVEDVRAEKMVKNEGYSYCPKSEWKVERDADKIRQKAEKKKKDIELEKEQQNAVIAPPTDKSKKELRSDRNKSK